MTAAEEMVAVVETVVILVEAVLVTTDNLC